MTGEPHACTDLPWTRSRPAVLLRGAVLRCVFGTIIDSYARQRVTGAKRLADLDGAAIVVANHCSHVDTPVLLRSLPARVRARTVVAAAADYFYGSRLLGSTVSLVFGTVPLARRGGAAGLGIATHIDQLLADGWTVIMFAEGTRSRDGRVGQLRSGAAVLAVRHEVPIVPVHIAGTHAAMPVGSRWMTRPRRRGRHTIRVTFGAPITVAAGDEPRAVMERVRLHLAAAGAETAADVDRSDSGRERERAVRGYERADLDHDLGVPREPDRAGRP